VRSATPPDLLLGQATEAIWTPQVGLKALVPTAGECKTCCTAIVVGCPWWLEESYGKVPPFYPGGHWFFPVGEEMHQNVTSSFHAHDSYPVDARGCIYTFATNEIIDSVCSPIQGPTR
jgi:hypothetical protein